MRIKKLQLFKFKIICVSYFHGFIKLVGKRELFIKISLIFQGSADFDQVDLQHTSNVTYITHSCFACFYFSRNRLSLLSHLKLLFIWAGANKLLDQNHLRILHDFYFLRLRLITFPRISLKFRITLPPRCLDGFKENRKVLFSFPSVETLPGNTYRITIITMSFNALLYVIFKSNFFSPLPCFMTISQNF